MHTIDSVRGLEILDSRGRPTVKATCHLSSGVSAAASVPSGASTGAAEAFERRDNDAGRYQGLGCRNAVADLNGTVNEVLSGRSFNSQRELDHALLDLDGTSDKSRYGANAILAVSLSFARAVSRKQGIPLYSYFSRLYEDSTCVLPRPMINLYSGGVHAGNQVAIQDVLLIASSASTIDEVLAATYEIYQTAADRSRNRYGMRLLRADEGGLAPPFASSEEMLGEAVESIEAAGFEAGHDVFLAVDVAASHFYEDGKYRIGDDSLSSPEMIDRLLDWTEQYPIVSVEDGLAEEDWEYWPRLLDGQDGEQVQVVGDDLLCTNPRRIKRAIESKAANALLLKVNQIGTLTEAREACQLAQSAGWNVIFSARSGETEDTWLADLAVGWGGDQIKIGSITQSERLAKYNRLLAIEADTDFPIRGG